jgi:hypothetical protein
MTDTPTIGRQVHYVSYGTPGGEYQSVCRTATITDVGAWMPDPAAPPVEREVDGVRCRTVEERWEPEACALLATPPSGLFLNTCRHDPGGTSDTPGAPTARSYQGGTWHWPTRHWTKKADA